MPGGDRESDLSERTEAFLVELKRSGSGAGPFRASVETAKETAALLRKITAQARWSSAGQKPASLFVCRHYVTTYDYVLLIENV